MTTKAVLEMVAMGTGTVAMTMSDGCYGDVMGLLWRQRGGFALLCYYALWLC